MDITTEMSDKNYETVLEQCKVIIERDFVSCGLMESVEKRVLELVREWEKRKAEADRKGKKIGGLRVIFMDLFRAVEKAESDSKKFDVEKCEYLRKGLCLPFTVPSGLGYWSLSMWQ